MDSAVSPGRCRSYRQSGQLELAQSKLPSLFIGIVAVALIAALMFAAQKFWVFRQT
jgi:hypothetical protein